MESATNSPLDKNNNGSSKCGKIMSKGSKNYEKYSLRPRSIQVRIETEKRRKEDRKKEPKPKQKPPPLSKYRRKTANARERTRMKEINLAFDNLQKLVPSYPQLPVNSTGRTCEKLTKITTLRLAMNYIDNLKSLLTSSSLEDDFSSGSASSASSTCGSNSLSAHSEFSPGSAYTLSPVSSPPDCLQTVMRGVVSPSFALSPASSTSGSSVASPGPCSSAASPSSSSSTSSTMVSNPGTFPATNIVIMPKYQQLHQHHQPHFQSRMLLSQLNNNGMSVCNGTNISSTSSSFQSFNIHDYLPSPQMTPGAATNLSYTQPYASNVLSNSFADSGRIISSLNDSDLSEYASDLLSDTGDDPMFEDLIGVGVVASDFPDLLLEADDNLHFANDLTIPGH